MKTLTRQGIQRMTTGGTTVIGGSGSGSGSGSGGGSADYAAEAGHAVTADEATNADKVGGKTPAELYNSANTYCANPNTELTNILLATIEMPDNDVLTVGGFVALFTSRETIEKKSFWMHISIRRTTRTNVQVDFQYVPLGESDPQVPFVRSNDGVNFYVYLPSPVASAETNGWRNYYSVTKFESERTTFKMNTVDAIVEGTTTNVNASRGGIVKSATFATKDADGNVITTTYLKLSGGTMTGTLKIATGKGIENENGAGMLVYKPATGWTGIDNTKWGVGAIDAIGVIRSSDSELIHYRGNDEKVILSSANSSVDKVDETLTVKINNTTKSLTNTWRPVIDNLTSEETDKSLSAKQGKVLNDKFASYVPWSAHPSISFNFAASSQAGGKWHRLGNYKTAGDSTNFIIMLYSGPGYNANGWGTGSNVPYNQNAFARIVVKDGWQDPTSNPSHVGAPYSVGISCERFGQPYEFKVVAVATSNTEGALWVYFPTQYVNGTYTISGVYESWTHNSGITDDTTTEPESNQQPTFYFDNIYDTNIHGTQSGNIVPNDVETLDIGSNTYPLRYIYARWIGAKSGNQFNLGANDATAITIDTNQDIILAANLGKSNNKVNKIFAKNIETENLTVTKEAHFFKLVVDEFMSNKGALIVTCANCIAEKVVTSGSTYKVYFSKVDKDGNSVTNPFVVNDQALCLTFKGDGAGTFSNVSNRYYWRIVTSVTSDDNDYHMVALSNASGQYEGSTTPAAGDNIVQLGYRGNDSGNAYRKSAVIMSSYPTMDTGVTPPSLAFYKGINDFDLASHRYTFIDGLNNEFMGNFKILVNGSYTNLTTVLATIEGLISTVQKEVRGKNILPSEGWTDLDGNLLSSSYFVVSTQRLKDFGGDDIICSPVMFMPKGTYCFSMLCDRNDSQVSIYVSSTNKKSANDIGGTPTVYSVNQTVSGTTRRYFSFTLQDDSYVIINVYNDHASLDAYQPQLEIGSTPTAYEIGSTENKSSVLKQTADGLQTQVNSKASQSSLTQTASEIRSEVSDVQQMFRGKNILPSEGWTDKYGVLLSSTNFNPSTQQLSDTSASNNICSPVLFLTKGTYCFSMTCDYTDSTLALYASSDNKRSANDIGGTPTAYTINQTVSGTTRRYCTFTLQNDSYVVINLVVFSATNPQLELGSTPTAYEVGNVIHSSQVRQTADSYNISIRNGLTQTGININAHKILAKTNNFEIQNTLGVKTFGVDANGNLESSGNASFKGTVKAENFYQAMTLIWNNRKAWVLDVDPTSDHVTYIWYHSACTDSGFITYQNNALGSGNRYSVGDIIPYNQSYDTDDYFAPSGGAFGWIGVGYFLSYTGISSIIQVVDDSQSLLLSGITIPAAKDLKGKIIDIYNRTSSNTVKVYAREVSGSVASQIYNRINGYPTYDATYAGVGWNMAPKRKLTLYSDGTYWIIISNDIISNDPYSGLIQ